MHPIVMLRNSGMVWLKDPSIPRFKGNLQDIFSNIESILKAIPATERENVFYAVHSHKGNTTSLSPCRDNDSFQHAEVMPFDIDKGVDLTKPFAYVEAICDIIGINPGKCTVINSGHGIHVLAFLSTAIRDVNYYKKSKPAYVELTYKIDNRFKELGLPGSCDTNIWDGARVLRLPGTINQKYNKDQTPRPGVMCELLQEDYTQHELDIYALSGFSQLEKENVSPQEVKRLYPTPDLSTMIQECGFLKSCLDDPSPTHEPQVLSFMSMMTCVPETITVDNHGKLFNPKELASHVFENSSSSSIAKSDFETKWEHSKRYGAKKCATIGADSDACRSCKYNGKINTPLALKSELHIGSAEAGYWQTNGKGNPVNPHYHDLWKVYSEENPYVTLTDKRILRFNGAYYIDSSDIEVKNWLERKVNPVEPLREQHRIEFLNKIKTAGVIGIQKEEEFFGAGIKGRLNCANGVLDIVSGVLIPHGPSMGFRNILPYDYNPSARSEFFMDWLAMVMQDRTDLMDSVLDFMAYCLWPSYDDHCFMYLLGGGRNGKSTLIEIIRALVGHKNCSAVNIKQLCGNRFSPSNLENKLVNLSEESSGTDGELGSDSLDILKNLSAGGTMTIERKGTDGFEHKNTAKLIFSANKAPRFFESGKAIRSRLVVIPFDHVISNTDSTIGDRLATTEIPGIMSILIERIRNKIQESGRFIVSRGGYEAEKAQVAVLTAGNTVVQWAKYRVDYSNMVPDHKYIACDDAYRDYTVWCGANGYRNVMAAPNFGKTMNTFVLNGRGSKVRTFTGKALRVYEKVMFREEMVDEE